jgi:hypothetical protein
MPWYAWILGPPEAVLGFLVTWPAFWRWLGKKIDEREPAPPDYWWPRTEPLIQRPVPSPEQFIVTCSRCGAKRVVASLAAETPCVCQQRYDQVNILPKPSVFDQVVDTVQQVMVGTAPEVPFFGQWQDMMERLFGIPQLTEADYDRANREALDQWRRMQLVPPHMIGRGDGDIARRA